MACLTWRLAASIVLPKSEMPKVGTSAMNCLASGLMMTLYLRIVVFIVSISYHKLLFQFQGEEAVGGEIGQESDGTGEGFTDGSGADYLDIRRESEIDG